MAVILEERGFEGVQKVRAECSGFKCDKAVDRCCCRRMLFNEPDFVNVESLLEITCKARGYAVIFLPKFHCELNFIEQCWGFAKRKYRLNPPSSLESKLESNVIAALDTVPLQVMRRYALSLSFESNNMTACVTDLQHGLSASWMPIERVSMANKQRGQVKNIVDIASFRTHS
jgi:hypothetical protein